MSLLSSRALHEQLAGILAALSKAALAEMCAAVDQGFAALHADINRRQKENEDLRKKLNLIESIVLKGSSGGEASVEDEKHSSKSTPTHDSSEAREKERAEAAVERPEAGRTPEQFPDVVLIKDEDSDTNDNFEEDEKLCVDNKQPQSPQLKPEDNAPRRSSPSDTNQGLNSIEHNSGPVYSLDSPEGEMVCSYSSQMDTDIPFVKLECSVLPPICPVENRAQFFNCNTQSPSTELDPWTKPLLQPSFEPYPENSEALGLKLIGISGSFSENSPGFDFANSTHFGLYRADQSGVREQSNSYKCRRFLCSVCNKTYATAQNLEVHMRIHTGERPFRCDQCGKRFTQSAHLKGHMSMHTDDKPYRCSLCSRGFVVLSTLKLHMKKCHPDVKTQL